MKRILIIILISIVQISNAQDSIYCSSKNCSLPKNSEAHFDPYYNGHLCENFDSKQADFSKEYLNLRTQRISKIATDKTNQIEGYVFDIDSVFNSLGYPQMGIIGLDYKRIEIYISSTELVQGNLEFIIKGKSNVSNNVCDFQGTLTVLNVFELIENYDLPGQAVLFAEYEFFEDKTQNHVGIFKGTFECAIIIDNKAQTVKLDETAFGADGYFNRTYVGTWTSYDSKDIKKCIWGDYRLPFTFDFDVGDGELMVNEKYVNYGWSLTDKKTSETQSNQNQWWK